MASRTGLGLSGLLRRKEAEAKALLDAGVEDEAILAAAIAQPIVIERPIVETAKGAVIGRPVERVLEVL
ncbi:arsenate reductase-like glutaredoxin family protein [Brevundimonas vesicularis]|uniref:ArsC/Spx/MgsR family protein n=1 Tax=Brevundimonas vesicularis TaxID=41276 RepID=UPI002787A619|nr:arsenate reductase-like glutaredoxin family protein [Brevundimonas vesicularis]